MKVNILETSRQRVKYAGTKSYGRSIHFPFEV